MNQQQRDRLAAGWTGRIQWDVDMAGYSTLRAGGTAGALIDVQELEELRNLLVLLEQLQISWKVIGRGSNILVSDKGYNGVIIRLQGELSKVTLLDKKKTAGNRAVIRVGAGCSMPALVSWCMRNGLAGLEFMVGIPGSVGGAVWMNSGAWGHEIGERLQAIELVDCRGYLKVIPVSDVKLSYRRIDLQEGDSGSTVISSTTFVLHRDHEEQIDERCKQYLERRRGRQPAGVASAGSFFKNPPGDSAGRLIEACGLKGACCGQAKVSEVHANFIVNMGRATAAEIIALMQRVQDEVFKQFGIRLEPEVQIL